MSDIKKYDITKTPPDGAFIFGLHLEGCRWNSELEYLADSFHGELYTEMPYIWLKP